MEFGILSNFGQEAAFAAIGTIVSASGIPGLAVDGASAVIGGMIGVSEDMARNDTIDAVKSYDKAGLVAENSFVNGVISSSADGSITIRNRDFDRDLLKEGYEEYYRNYATIPVTTDTIIGEIEKYGIGSILTTRKDDCDYWVREYLNRTEQGR